MSQPTFELATEMVRAGAGAGKTHSLVEKVVDTFTSFRAHQQRSPHIVVSTFTRKATQELKERFLLRACYAKDFALIEYMSDGSKLHVSTIHGLLSLFLRQVAHLAEIDPGFQIMEEGAAKSMQKQVLRDVLLHVPDSLYWLEQFGFQRLLEMCVSWGEMWFAHPDLKPGTLDDLESARNECALKIRSDLQEWSARILEEADDLKWQDYAHNLGRTAELWDGDFNSLEFPKKASRTQALEHLEELDRELVSAIKRIKDTCASSTWDTKMWPQMVEAWNRFHPMAQEFHTRLQARKKLIGQFEMVDLEYLTLSLLREKPFLAESFADNWDLWMIDEFQDTSEIQIEILKQLIGNSPAYYVGDPQQSIYLFRGARAEIFMNQWREFTTQNWSTRSLQKNFRSSPPLLHFINDLVSDLGNAFEKMEADGEAPSKTIAQVVRAPSVEIERAYVVDRVIELVRGGARLETICILGRTHRQLMELASRLKEIGLPTHVHSPSGFWQRRETLDVHSLWRFFLNPHDNENLITLLRSPYFFISDSFIIAEMSHKPTSLWRRLCAQGDAHDSILRLKEVLKVSEERGVVTGFEQALMDSGIFDLALKSDPAGRKESNLWKFLLRVKELEREGGAAFLSLEPSVQDDDLQLEGDAASSQEPNCINLMTIHGSKGLEFDHVIVPHMGDSPRLSSTPRFCGDEETATFSFPIVNSDDSASVTSPLERKWLDGRRQRERDESKRWLYVAITRAKESLTLTASEIKDDSWASALSVFRSPPGRLNRTQYSIDVVDVNELKPRTFSLQQEKKSVRGLFQNLEEATVSRRQSVTAMLSQTEEKALPANVVYAISQKKAQGVLVHRVLEAMRFHHEWNDPELARPIEYVRALTEPPMEELLAQGHVEWGFQIQTPSGLLEGQIDLWGLVDNELWIIDYKSGSQEFKEKAFEQLSLYAWALRRFEHTQPIRLAVIYPMSETVEVRALDPQSLIGWENKLRGAK